MAGREEPTGGVIRTTVQGALKLDDRKYHTLTTYIKSFISEMFGTGLLVFLGCMGVQTNSGSESHLGVTLSFGIAAFIAIQICVHNSGGHINPALTIVAVFFKHVTIPMALNYIAGQCLGGILGFGLLLALTPEPKVGLCNTIPNEKLSSVQAVAFEAVMTAVLMLAVCSVWDPRNGQYLDSVTLKFGFVIFSLAYAGVAYTGCSMNPARTLGPAIWNNAWERHWVYWVGPFLGALFAALSYKTFFCGPLTPKVQPKDKVEMETITSS